MDNKEDLTKKKVAVLVFDLFFIMLLIFVTKPTVPWGIFQIIVLTAIMTKVTIWPKPKTREDVIQEKEIVTQRELLSKDPILKHYGSIFLIGFAICIPLLIQTRWPLMQLLSFFIIFFGTALLLFAIRRIRQKKANQDQNAVASELGLAFSATDDAMRLPQVIKSFGKNLRLGNVFSGVLDGFHIRIFDLSYMFAKNASYNVTLLEITSTRICPEMFILSKTDSFVSTITPSQISSGVSVRLEGDFPDYFSVYVAQGAEDDVRVFLTPDIMATLIDEMSHMSYIFTENKVYVVLSNNTVGGFMKDIFLEEIKNAHFIISKWSPILSRNA